MNVVFYLPNIIAYIRIVLIVLAFLNFNACYTFVAYYVASHMLNAVSRVLSKLLKQETPFGNILSMIIDRAATDSLLIMLAHLYPQHKFMFIASMILDMMSHWYLLNSSLAIKLDDHRLTSEDTLVSIYYKMPLLVGMVVLLCEQFYLMYYIGYHYTQLWDLKSYMIMFYISAGVYVLKQFVHIHQIKVSLLRYIKMDQANALTATAKKDNK